MRTRQIIICLLLLTSSSDAQLQVLTKFENSLKKKIEVGMSTEEVKKVLGRPKAIEGGFPDESKTIISDLPEQKGQMNNSTWFYFDGPISVKVDESTDTSYVLNGKPVVKELFDDYVGKDTVYYHDGAIIYSVMTQSYKDMRDPRLRGYPIDRKQTYLSKPNAKKVSKTFFPIFCVIFDRGTQVVASTKILFQVKTQ